MREPRSLDELVRSARLDAPSAAELAQGAEGLERALARGGAGSAGGGAGAAGAKLVILALVGAGAIAVGALTLRGAAPEPLPPPPAQPAVAEPVPALSPIPTPSVVAPVELLPIPVEASATPRSPRSTPPSAAPVARMDAPPAAPARSEAEILQEARSALATNPVRALALVGEHQKAYPRGFLAPEREVLAIEALAKSGRAAEAKARADRFLRANPSSAHRARLERIVGL